MHKAGFVNIVGNPNVGKSTLMNVLVGERISIATFKAQTTRHRIMGIYNTDDMQIVFSDTPGVLKPNYKLQESMLNFSTSALTDADVLLYVTDVVETPDKHNDFVEKVGHLDVPVLLLINKIDLSNQEKLVELVEAWKELLPKAEIIPISATSKFNVDYSFYFFLFVPLIFIVFLHWGRTYIRLLSIGEMIRRTFWSVLYSVVVYIVILFLAGKAPVVSRLFVTLLGTFVFSFVCVGRLVMRHLLNRYSLFLEPTIMIGSDETAKKFLNYTTSNVFFGIRVVGLIDDNPKGKALSGKFPILGPTSKATEIIKGTGVQNVLILAPKMDPKKLNLLVDELFPLVKNVSFVPDTEEMPVSNMELHRLYSENLIVLSVKNNLSRWYNQFVKRVFDLVVSVIGTLLISPFLLVIAILIKATSPGPAIYAHMRLGRHGKMFPCYKFRSMVKDADKKLAAYLASNPSAKAEWEREQKLKNDPRVTRVGMFLRKTSLDELPQLFNVIIGDMSLVGPRPITRSEVCKYGTYFSDYEMVRPGMTGLWQTSGRSDTSYDRRVRLDAWYVRNWNLWLDISMLVKTVRVLLSKDSGAY